MYIERMIICKGCAEDGRNSMGQQFVSTDPSIPSINKERLSRFQRNYEWRFGLETKGKMLQTLPTGIGSSM